MEEKKEGTFQIDESLLCRAINKWGPGLQALIAIEEMAELTQALIRGERGRVSNVAEEIADVMIMVTQLALCQRSSVQKEINFKLERLKSRLDSGD